MSEVHEKPYTTEEERRAYLCVRELVGEHSDEYLMFHARRMVENIRVGQREDADR